MCYKCFHCATMCSVSQFDHQGIDTSIETQGDFCQDKGELQEDYIANTGQVKSPGLQSRATVKDYNPGLQSRATGIREGFH